MGSMERSRSLALARQPGPGWWLMTSSRAARLPARWARRGRGRCSGRRSGLRVPRKSKSVCPGTPGEGEADTEQTEGHPLSNSNSHCHSSFLGSRFPKSVGLRRLRRLTNSVLRVGSARRFLSRVSTLRTFGSVKQPTFEQPPSTARSLAVRFGIHPRGQYIITQTPMRAIHDPMTSMRSGRLPSKDQPHKSESTMKNPP